MYDVPVKATPPWVGGVRRHVDRRDQVRVKQLELFNGNGGLRRDRRLSVKHFHRVVKVKLPGQAGGSFRITSKLFKVSRAVGVRKWSAVARFGWLDSGDVAINVAVCLRPHFHGMQRCSSMGFAPEVVCADGEEAGEQVVVDGRWGSAPVNATRVEDLFSKGGRAGGLDAAKNRPHREALCVRKEARGGGVRGAFASRASGAASNKYRKCTGSFGVAWHFVGVEGGQDRSSVGSSDGGVDA